MLPGGAAPSRESVAKAPGWAVRKAVPPAESALWTAWDESRTPGSIGCAVAKGYMHAPGGIDANRSAELFSTVTSRMAPAELTKANSHASELPYPKLVGVAGNMVAEREAPPRERHPQSVAGLGAE
jgi:hypothetical protein